MTKPTAIAVFTHDQPHETGDGLRRLIAEAGDAGIEVHIAPAEAEKHRLGADDGAVLSEDAAGAADLAVVLGGDGTMLRALRTFAGRPVPVFAFNFGAIGFLSTVDHGELDGGLVRALSGDFEVLGLPALSVEVDGRRRLAVNDVSFHRRADDRVAQLAYAVEQERLGEVRCDGLVASTPVGSTGYNLANGGPVLAWGVEGYVVSFIAPHTLTARALVAATDDPLLVTNLSLRDEVDVMTDGRCVGSLAPGADLEVRFEHDQALLAQIPGSSFYHRLRQKFGRLAYTGA
ncbi:MAG: NAD(+)/NADH kinase [Thermoleophilaceae bacterium]|nr:NAD(+)/NADH kinase [Thermoleophilaceae bacterium]MBA3840151.1 NAD(+)/NADH kinase [Thermoleophilaceae bacterium]